MSGGAHELPAPEIKLLLCGDNGVGMGDFLRLHPAAEGFGPRHLMLIRVDIYTLEFDTARGPIRFSVWFAPGMYQPKTSEVWRNDCYSVQAQCAIFMFDATTPKTRNFLLQSHHDATRIHGAVPSVVCGNWSKAESKEDRTTTDANRRFMNLQYFDIDTSDGYNCVPVALLGALRRSPAGDPEPPPHGPAVVGFLLQLCQKDRVAAARRR